VDQARVDGQGVAGQRLRALGLGPAVGSQPAVGQAPGRDGRRAVDDRVDRSRGVQQLMARHRELGGDRGAQHPQGTGDVHATEVQLVHPGFDGRDGRIT
jgi:hypothetical protein